MKCSLNAFRSWMSSSICCSADVLIFCIKFTINWFERCILLWVCKFPLTPFSIFKTLYCALWISLKRVNWLRVRWALNSQHLTEFKHLKTLKIIFSNLWVIDPESSKTISKWGWLKMIIHKDFLDWNCGMRGFLQSSLL